MRTIVEPKKEIPVAREVDVIVAGAGVAGIAAAIASARNEADTLLVERNGVVGGVAIAGMVLAWANTFFTPDEVLAKGIGMELLDRVARRGGTSPRWAENFTATLDPEIFQAVVLEMLEEAGVKLLTHTLVADAIVRDDALQGIIVESKSGRQAIVTKVTVDATGDADVAARAGAPYKDEPQGRSTLCFRMANIDLDRTYEFLKENPGELVPWETASTRFDFEYVEKMWLENRLLNFQDNSPLVETRKKAIEQGEFADDLGICQRLGRMAICGTGWNGMAAINTGAFSVDHLDQFEITKAEVQGRKAAFYVAAFLIKYVPGFENAFIVSIAHDLGVRITRRIIGEYVFTTDDAERHARFKDVVGRTHGRYLRYGEPGVDIPYRILVPKEIDNLLIGSGKSVSADFGSIGEPLRNMQSTAVIGEAAGTAAAIAAESNVTPRNLDVRRLQEALIKQGAHLGNEARLKELGLA